MTNTQKMAGLVAVFVVACGDVSTAPPMVSNEALWSVESTVASAVMATAAPYDTMTLIPILRTVSGRQVESRNVVFTPSDSTLIVSANGVVTAIEPTSLSYILIEVYDSASLRMVKDSVFIKVTEDIPSSKLVSFALGVAPGDSAKLGVVDGDLGERTITQLVPTAITEDGQDVTDQLIVEYKSRSPSTVSVEQFLGVVRSVIAADTVTIVALTTFYGITKADSIRFVTGYPLVVNGINFGPVCDGEGATPCNELTYTIGVGGTVIFHGGEHAYEVVFDRPEAVYPSPSYISIPTGFGNIPEIVPVVTLDDLWDCWLGYIVCNAARTFPQAGTYRYRDPRSGTGGTIIVTTP